MATSSEYDFPIFISSTVLDLIDLRAELEAHLANLGYRAVLSNNEGFPDNYPDLEPWESCLRVLDQQCFVQILIIDGRYGSPVAWPNFAKIIGDREVSPTHAEYLFARGCKKRILVFVRSSLLTHYESYKETMKRHGGNSETARVSLSQVLPPNIEFSALQFLNEIKTHSPIPWIKEFKDVTDIKREVQKKMLNELAELFLVKNNHLQTVVGAFSKVMNDLAPDKRNEVLRSIGVTGELISKLDENATVIKELKTEKTKLSEQISKNSKNERRVKELVHQVGELETRIQEREKFDALSLIGESGIYRTKITATPNFSLGLGDLSTISGISWPTVFENYNECKKCKKSSAALLTGITDLNIQRCPKCSSGWCRDCWSVTSLDNAGGACPDCRRDQRAESPA